MNDYRAQYAKYTRHFQNLAQAALAKPEVRASLEVLLTFLTVSFFAIFAIRPTLQTIAELASQTKSQQEIAKTLDQKLASLAEAQATWSQEQASITLLEEALPENPAPDRFIAQIEALGALHNVSLESFSVGKTQLFGKATTAQEKSFDVSLSVAGPFENTANFFQDIENLRRTITITTFSLGPSKKQGEKDQIILTIGGKVPYLGKALAE